MTDDENKIKIFASDDNLKSLGELLSNETSRKIIINLMSREMYTNEIATKLDLRVSLVIHHLRKLEELGLLEIENKKIKRKGEEHRFFKMNSDIFITLDKNKEDVAKKGILSRIFREGIKFTLIGIVAFSSSFIKLPTDQKIIDPVPFGVEPINTVPDFFLLPLIVLIIGLIIERAWFGLKKRKMVN